MKPFDYYSKPQTLYPNKKDYITFYVYDRGACIYSESALSNTKSALKEDYPNAVIQEVLDEEAYKAHHKQYNTESAKLHDEFVNDLFEEFGVTDNPKRHKAFEYARDKGGSYSDVYDVFTDIVELIED
jgi:methyltransferase-like protein